eukprot:8233669-Pyramimonas_sp.AAC.1
MQPLAFSAAPAALPAVSGDEVFDSAEGLGCLRGPTNNGYLAPAPPAAHPTQQFCGAFASTRAAVES